MKKLLQTATSQSQDVDILGTIYKILHLPVIVGYQGPIELYLVLGAGTHPPDPGLTLLDDIQQHLGQLGVLVQIHKVRQFVVHLEGDASFL